MEKSKVDKYRVKRGDIFGFAILKNLFFLGYFLVLHLHRKQDLIDKFMADNKGMDEARADAEVSKFLLDAEMANAYIKFEKDKVLNPPDLKAEAEQTLSDPKTIATYVAWLIGGASFGFIRKEFIEPKYASGEWEEFHIQLPFQDLIKPASETAAEAATPVAKLSDSVIGAADAVHDSIVTALS